jgi:hypothetical protein
MRAQRGAQDERQFEAARDWLLGVIRDFEQRGEYLTTATTSAHSLFHTVKGEKGFPKGMSSDQINRVVRSLDRDGRILRKEVMKNRKAREVFIVAPEQPVVAPMPVTTGLGSRYEQEDQNAA